jgi:hypothetical protein
MSSGSTAGNDRPEVSYAIISSDGPPRRAERGRAGPPDCRRTEGDRRPGRRRGATFDPKTHWKGARHGVTGNSVDFDLWVGPCDGDTFRGTIRFDEGNARMKVTGVLDGWRIDFETTEMIRGQARSLHFGGYIVNGQMLLTVSGISTTGTRQGDLAPPEATVGPDERASGELAIRRGPGSTGFIDGLVPVVDLSEATRFGKTGSPGHTKSGLIATGDGSRPAARGLRRLGRSGRPRGGRC